MWGVSLSDTHALVNDTHNGFFLIDVREPTSPRHVGWYSFRWPATTPVLPQALLSAAEISLWRGRLMICTC